jgi:transcriptional regulator with XRE-family HTH domain
VAPPLEALGLLIRAARMKRRVTQQRAAKGAGVSRKQWGLLERGANVSVVFLRKVATYLDLKELPLGEGLQGTTTSSAFDAVALLHLSDDLAAIVERLNVLAIDAALPPSETRGDSAAIAAFVAGKGQLTSSDAARLERAFHRFASDVISDSNDTPPAARKNARRRKREA